MREIKFRAWIETEDSDDENKKYEMCYDLAFEDYEPINDLLNNFDNGQAIMQYTGLKDKNGKEIYEGDIIKTSMHYSDDDGNSVPPAEIKIFEVKWVENEGMQYCGFSLFPSDDIYNLEIIGNIYENSELLGEK